MLLDQSALEPERFGGFGVTVSGDLCAVGQPGQKVDDGQHGAAVPVCEPFGTGEGMSIGGAKGHSVGLGPSLGEDRKPTSHAEGV